MNGWAVSPTGYINGENALAGAYGWAFNELEQTTTLKLALSDLLQVSASGVADLLAQQRQLDLPPDQQHERHQP
jgi:hypothetical protein